MTPWAEYINLNPLDLIKIMKGNLIFDATNIWHEFAKKTNNFTYINIGGRSWGG
jgi:hypothetical protein